MCYLLFFSYVGEPPFVPTPEEIPLSSLISPSSTTANILSPQYSASEGPLQKMYAVQPEETNVDETNTYLKLVIPGMKRGE